MLLSACLYSLQVLAAQISCYKMSHVSFQNFKYPWLGIIGLDTKRHHNDIKKANKYGIMTAANLCTGGRLLILDGKLSHCFVIHCRSSNKASRQSNWALP